MNSLTPAGSISGAPKSSAINSIAEIENSPRGPYCGVIGWIQGEQAVISVGIRLFWSIQDGKINFGTGAGITWQSEPKSEWDETELKADRLISIAGGSR
jgi:para-aminobenzoate synthetase component 1